MRRFLKPTGLTAVFAVLLVGALVVGCGNGNNGGAALLPPPTPTIAGIVGTDGGAELNWAAVERAVFYQVAWKLTADDEWPAANMTEVTTLYYAIAGLTNNVSYDVRILAGNAAGVSDWSAVAAVTPTATPTPAMPTALTATHTAYEGEIYLTWAHAGLLVNFFEVEVTPYGGAPTVIGNVLYTLRSLTVGELTDGVRHYFRIRAGNTTYTSFSLWTLPASAVPGPQTDVGPVTALSMTANAETSVTLTWTLGANATAVNIWFGEDLNVESATAFGTTHAGTTATVTGLTRETLYTMWVRGVSGPFYSEWARVTTATAPFTQAFDIVVVGAGAAGGSAVFGARSVGFEDDVMTITPNAAGAFTAPGAVTTDPFVQDRDRWNDLSVLVVEKRHRVGGMTSTAGANNAMPGNQAQFHAWNETFTAFRDRFRIYVQSPVTLGAGNHGNPAIANDPTHVGHIPLSADYPNWSKSWAVLRQMRDINTLLVGRGRPGLGDTAPTNLMFARIENMQNPLAVVRRNTEATELITTLGTGTGGAGVGAQVIGVVTRNVIGNQDAEQNTVHGTLGGAEERIAARRVIIAAGGFSNLRADQKIAYGLVPPHGNIAAAHFAPNGHVNSYGRGILMAMRIGAGVTANYGAINNNLNLARHLRGIGMASDPIDGAAVGNWGAFFGNAQGFGATANMWRQQQIMVNNQGLRFRVEPVSNGFTNAINYDITRPDAWPVWAIFSDVDLGANITPGAGLAGPAGGARPRLEVLNTVHTHLQTLPSTDMRRNELVRGATLNELAIAMNLPEARRSHFVNEVIEYDRRVRLHQLTGDSHVAWVDPLTQPTHPNHVAGRPGKAAGNLIRFFDVDNPTGDTAQVFWAIRMHPTVWDSMGGLATDMWGRVLRNELPRAGGGGIGTTATQAAFDVNYVIPANQADIIRNLYAVGASANRWFYGYQYQSMSSVGVAGVQGGLAGLHAARSILGVAHSLPNDAQGTPWPVVVFQD